MSYQLLILYNQHIEVTDETIQQCQREKGEGIDKGGKRTIWAVPKLIDGTTLTDTSRACITIIILILLPGYSGKGRQAYCQVEQRKSSFESSPLFRKRHLLDIFVIWYLTSVDMSLTFYVWWFICYVTCDWWSDYMWQLIQVAGDAWQFTSGRCHIESLYMTDEMKVMIFACKVTRGPRSCSPRVARHRGARLSLFMKGVMMMTTVMMMMIIHI